MTVDPETVVDSVPAPGEPGAAVAEVDLSAEINATLEQMLANMPDDEAETAKPVGDTAKEAGEPKTAQAAAELPKTGQADQKAPEPTPDRGAERLAAREAEVANKEKALREREREIQTLTSKMRRGEFADALKSMGFEDREIPLVIRAAMATQLPADKVPEQYRQHAKELSTEDRYRAMITEAMTEAKSAKAELLQYQQQVAQQQYVAQYQSQAEDYFSKSAETEAPTFARLLKADRNEATKRFYAVVAADANAKLAKGEPAEAMSPADAAKAVEAELSRLASLIATGTTSTPTTKTVVNGNPSPSLSTKTVPAASRRPSAMSETVDTSVDRWIRENGLG